MSGIDPLRQPRLPTILDRLQKEVFTPSNEQLLNMVINHRLRLIDQANKTCTSMQSSFVNFYRSIVSDSPMKKTKGRPKTYICA